MTDRQQKVRFFQFTAGYNIMYLEAAQKLAKLTRSVPLLLEPVATTSTDMIQGRSFVVPSFITLAISSDLSPSFSAHLPLEVLEHVLSGSFLETPPYLEQSHIT
jgi:hypothetical protein